MLGSSEATSLDNRPPTVRAARLTELKERFGLAGVGSPFSEELGRFVAPGTARDGRALVLKVFEDSASCERAAAALRHWSGHGAVQLLDHDSGLHALLLQRAEPGSTLDESGSDPAASARTFAQVARRLHVGGRPPRLPHLSGWLVALGQPGALGSGAGEEERRRAAEMAEKLVARGGSPVLLHGDLHHANIVRHGHGWLAIDPKGVVGPREAEAAAFLRNPRDHLLGRPDAVAVSELRATTLAAELDFDRAVVLAWAYVLCVLAAAWAVEDVEGEEGVSKWMACAAVLRLAADAPEGPDTTHA
jgi:streptomycin 6-kinase